MEIQFLGNVCLHVHSDILLIIPHVDVSQTAMLVQNSIKIIQPRLVLVFVLHSQIYMLKLLQCSAFRHVLAVFIGYPT